jgi:tetratricopeptide (TPR) repeat protein
MSADLEGYIDVDKIYHASVSCAKCQITLESGTGDYDTARQSVLDQAVAAYRQAIALQPSYAEAHQNLGVALFNLGELPQALQSFNQAIQLYATYDPDTAQRLKQGVHNLGMPRDLLAEAQLI